MASTARALALGASAQLEQGGFSPQPAPEIGARLRLRADGGATPRADAGAGEGGGAGVRSVTVAGSGTGAAPWSKMEINLHRLLSRCEARAAEASDDHLVADAKFHTVSPQAEPMHSVTVLQ